MFLLPLMATGLSRRNKACDSALGGWKGREGTSYRKTAEKHKDFHLSYLYRKRNKAFTGLSAGMNLLGISNQ